MGILAALLAAGTVIDSAFGNDGEGIGSEQLTKSMLGNADAVQAFSDEIGKYQDKSSAGWWNVNEISDYGDALDAAFNPSKRQQVDHMAAGFVGLFGIADQSGVTRASEAFTAMDTNLSKLVSSGNAAAAATQFAQLSDEAKAQGISIEQLKSLFPQYAEALAAADNQQKLTGDGAKDMGAGVAGTIPTVEEAADAAEKYAKAIDDAKSAIIAMGGGLRAEQQAIADSSEAYKAARGAIDGTRGEQDKALRELSSSYLEVSAAQVEMGRGAGEVGATMETNRAKFIKTAVAMGYNATYAGELATAYGLVPDQVQTMVSQIGAETAAAQITDLNQYIKNDLTGKTVTIAEAGATPSMQRVLKLDGSIFGPTDKQVTVQSIGETASGERVVSLDGKIYVLRGKTVAVTANVSGSGAVDSLKSKLNTLSGVYRAFVAVSSGGITRIGRAGGGAVYGPGTGTSDSIPAMLSNNEHVWTAAEVERLGGHAAMYAWRAAVRSGNLPKFADGGAVMSTSRAAQYAARPAPAHLIGYPSAPVAPVVREGDRYTLYGVPYNAAGDVAAALSFARRSEQRRGAYA